MASGRWCCVLLDDAPKDEVGSACIPFEVSVSGGWWRQDDRRGPSAPRRFGAYCSW